MLRTIVPLAFFASLALGACASNSGATGITPITGIVLRSDTLVAGHGCGTGAGQVFKYVAVVSRSDAVDGGTIDNYVAIGTYDCFADGTFVNLCASPSGNVSYVVNVYAFSAASWASAGPQVGGLALPATICSPDAGPADATAAQKTLASLADWTTSCTAQQQQSIEVLAVCGPLQPAHS